MKIALIFLFLTTTLLAGDCYLPIGSSWIEQSDAPNRLALELPNDRNLYIHYLNQKDGHKLLLSHKIYACDEKYFYVNTDDNYVELFAFIEPLNSAQVILHFVDQYQIIKTSIPFNRIEK